MQKVIKNLENKPFFEVKAAEPKLVDQVGLLRSKNEVVPTQVRIRDPFTNKPIALLTDIKVPLKPFTDPKDCINLAAHMSSGNAAGLDFGFDCTLNYLKDEKSPGETFLDLVQNPKAQTPELWDCIEKTLEVRRKYNAVLVSKWKKLCKELR
jgi:hypothetical protein